MPANLVETKDEKRSTLELIYSCGTSEMQHFRSAGAKIALGSSGFVLIMLGWVVSSNMPLSYVQRSVFTVALAVFVAFSVYMTRIMERHFLDLARVVHQIDCVLGMYERGKYVSDESLFPDHWKAFGSSAWKEPVFRAALVGMLLLGVFGVAVVWMV